MDAERRGIRRVFPPSPVRAIALVRLAAMSPIRTILLNIGAALSLFAAQLPLKFLGESLVRAELRAVAADLRALQDFLAEVGRRPAVFELSPADRDLCNWATARAREVALIAVRIERRLGPKPTRRGVRRVFPPSPVRAIALVRLAAMSPIRTILLNIGAALSLFAAQLPLKFLGESLVRAELRAVAADLRALQDFLAEVGRRPAVFELSPADRGLCDWATARAREVALIAMRIERRLGPKPKPLESPE